MGRGAMLVASGILSSRVVGLVRQRVFAHYFGVTDVADAFSQAFRIPNLVQNLFGEGVLSASFIPVYAGLRAQGDDAGRRRLAHATFSLLALACAVAVVAGMLGAPLLTRVIAPGFHGQKLELTTRLVRILFPGAAFFVLSAWSLGIQNSHGRFFLSYASAVVWNVAMVATMLAGGGAALPQLAVWLAWGSVAGAALQLAVQLPVVLALVGRVRLALALDSVHVRTVLRNFVPAFLGRGVAQISAFVDAVIASLLVEGAVATLTYSQLLYMLPISLFGVSISAAELPVMSGAGASTEDAAGALRRRLSASLSQMAFLVVPSAAAFLFLGDQLARLLFQTGRFGADEARWVWWTLAGSAIGLLAASFGRLMSSAFYALRDTQTPLRFAVVRVGLTIVLGLIFALWLPGRLGIDAKWGVAGLTSSAGIAAWIEYFLLRRALHARIGSVSLAPARVPALWTCALVAGGLSWGVRLTSTGIPSFAHSLAVVTTYGVTYLVATDRAGFPFMRRLIAKVRQRR